MYHNAPTGALAGARELLDMPARAVAGWEPADGDRGCDGAGARHQTRYVGALPGGRDGALAARIGLDGQRGRRGSPLYAAGVRRNGAAGMPATALEGRKPDGSAARTPTVGRRTARWRRQPIAPVRGAGVARRRRAGAVPRGRAGNAVERGGHLWRSEVARCATDARLPRRISAPDLDELHLVRRWGLERACAERGD
jgi:hypothetical protein